ncbi:MAG: tRNA (guanosine(37)-N1)-methyltransferase TrmD [Myxococcota bacterium]
MQFDILTLFPGMVKTPFEYSLMAKAQEKGLFSLKVHDLRDYATGRHRVCDDYPFGGGEGMVLKVEPIARALQALRAPEKRSRVLLMSPGGIPFSQREAQRLATYEQLVLLCGHYEGVDERVSTHLIDEALSIGDYVLTGGELAAMVVTEAVARLLPGVVKTSASVEQDSFSDGLLDHPQYTRPREFEGMAVPDVLLSGDHAHVARWRRREALRRTLLQRPDLLEQARLSQDDRKVLEALRREHASSQQ